MTPIALWFDAASPHAHAVFSHWVQAWAELGAGHAVVCEYRPVGAAAVDGLEGEALLQLAWAAAWRGPHGLAPSRWVCERLWARDADALRAAAVRHPDSPDVQAALRASRDALPFALTEGHAWHFDGRWLVGEAALMKALRDVQGLTAQD